jgi:hypothetical protein
MSSWCIVEWVWWSSDVECVFGCVGVVDAAMPNAGVEPLLLKSERSLLDCLHSYLMASFELIC